MRIGYLHAQISDAQISDATVTIDESANQTIDIAALRFGIGKTGVQLRFYKKKEFDKLPADQRNELKLGARRLKERLQQQEIGLKRRKPMVASLLQRKVKTYLPLPSKRS